MKKLAIITGTHTGIGRALAESMLQTQQYCVWGFSRKNDIQNPNFSFISADLATTEFVERLPDELPDFEEYVLINNAGIIHPIKPVESILPNELNAIYGVNIISVHLLCAWFIRMTSAKSALKTIVNISSGAGRYPITHWSAYCSTKAALDMLSECIALEYPAYRVYSLAPGMVDTPMQTFIRSKNKTEFPDVERFSEAHEKNLLNDPYFVSKRIIHLIHNPLSQRHVKISIKDI